jgi:hypothetical protein
VATLAMFEGGLAPCATAVTPHADTVYYVAVNEPGADNEACDGRSPTLVAPGQCPFKDFMHPRVRNLLVNTHSVRIEVRQGLYRFIPDDAIGNATANDPLVAEGLRLVGNGTGDDQRVSLINYQNERVLFDGEGHVRELVRLGGSYTALSGIALVNGGGYNIEINGGDHHHVRCNQVGWTGSDSVKVDGGATDCVVEHNEITDYSSQAIDITQVLRLRVAGNLMHHPRSDDGNATGTKYGATDVQIINNTIHHSGGLSLGGTSSDHADAFEAQRLIASGNVFHDVVGVVAKFYSCVDCGFHDNLIRSAGAGLYWEDQSQAGSSGCPGGCAPSSGTTVHGNRFANLDGGGDATQANTFAWLNPTEAIGIALHDNLYCVPPAQTARFWFNAELSFTAWQSAVNGDDNSEVLDQTDPRCTGW